MATVNPIGAKVITSDGHPGVFVGYRRQEEKNPRGRILTPPDKRWVLVVDLGEIGQDQACALPGCDADVVVHGETNYYAGQVHFVDTGALVPATPTAVDHLTA